MAHYDTIGQGHSVYGNIGLTSGRYRLVESAEQGGEKILSQGGYVTWWRKDSSGAWKVIFDTGSPDPTR